jgi:hypothetical protein
MLMQSAAIPISGTIKSQEDGMGSAARLLCAVLVLVSLPLPAQVQPGALGTLAGNGSHGYSSDNGRTWEAQLDDVYALAADAQGNLYIADSWNNCLRKLTPSGTLTTVAGTDEEGFASDNGLATAAKLFYPRGLAADAKGNLYPVEITMAGAPCDKVKLAVH